jgi:peptide/nickel transport system permease protein
VAGVVIGVAVGAWTASRQYRISDRVITALSLLVVSTPVFVIALLSQFLAIGVNRASGLQIFEFSGETGVVGAEPWAEVIDRAQHLALPALVLTLAGAAWLSRVQRHLMLEALGADYVRTARAKGLRADQAAWRHALRSALVPTSTYVTFSVATMLVGSTFVERIFGFAGLGSYVVEAIQGRDVNAVVAVTALAGMCVMIGAVVSDLAVAALDPRVRLT